MEGKKQKDLSSLYQDPAPAKSKASASARNRASSEENPCIASLKRHPAPPRRLPAHIAAAGRATGRDKSPSPSRQASTAAEEEINDGEEENPEIEEEEDIEKDGGDYIYAPELNDEEDDNAYDLNCSSVTVLCFQLVARELARAGPSFG